eukprot:6183261-Pleurochrysis_carterae.AAC.1
MHGREYVSLELRSGLYKSRAIIVNNSLEGGARHYMRRCNQLSIMSPDYPDHSDHSSPLTHTGNQLAVAGHFCLCGWQGASERDAR